MNNIHNNNSLENIDDVDGNGDNGGDDDYYIMMCRH